MSWAQRLLSHECLPYVVLVLKVLFFLLVANLLRMHFRAPSENGKSATPMGKRVARVFWLCIVPLFVGLLMYQATWQLTGFARPRLVDFMRRYNRRPVNPARKPVRGRILDAHDICIADNAPDTPRRRRYPLGTAFCHVAGYADTTFGLSGVERAEDAFLSGYTLRSRREAGSYGKNVLNRGSITGNDLSLTIDARLQTAATQLLHGKRGAVVALRPADGAVLALVSAPAFDPNKLSHALFQEGDNGSPLFNRALHGRYPPGSTFKIVTAMMAIEGGFRGKIDCPGDGFVAEKGARPIRDHLYYEYKREGRRWEGYGLLGLADAFARSSNVFFAHLGADMDSRRFTEAAHRLHLDRRILLLNGASGQIASDKANVPRLLEGNRRERAQVSIGQGRLLVTPMHMALIAAAVAEDGIAYRPRLRRSTAPEKLGVFMAPATAARLRALMRTVVEEGTGRGADIRGLEVAGKTGTAQAASGDDHAWFACFAPCTRPAIALAVVIEHGGYGSRSAVPVAVSLLEKANRFDLLERKGGDEHK